MIKYNQKYKYVSGQQYEHHGSRIYDFGNEKLPSVTTILGKTKDQKFLRDWQAKVGKDEAERIKNDVCKTRDLYAQILRELRHRGRI